ncbi:MAG: ABC transporter permease, partial [Clostridium sp.]
MIKETIKMSLNNIIYNKMRSFLTVLGIVIGVASVIALITIVQGTTSSVTKKVKSLGADKITVRATGTPLKQGLLDSDIKNLNKLKNVVGVSPSINGISSVAYERQVKEDVNVQGKNEVYFNKTDNLVKSGRGINIIDSESKNKVCLIGKNIKNEVFFSKDPIGKQMKIGEISYTIIGTLEESNNFSMNSSDNTVIIPYTTAMSFLSTRYINDIDVYMKNSDLADSTTSNVETVLKQAFNYNEDGYSVSNMESMLETIKEMTRMLSLMLGGIASISLIVGGIGIMN